MKSAWTRWFGAASFAASLALITAAMPATAQQGREDCRCVDRDGNEIENCSCFRMPQVDRLIAQIGLASRPRLGISVEVDQGARRDAQGVLVTDVMEGVSNWKLRPADRGLGNHFHKNAPRTVGSRSISRRATRMQAS